MVRDGRRNGKKHSCSDILGGGKGSTLTLATFFLVSLVVRSPAFARGQTSGGAFFRCEVCTHDSVSPDVPTVPVVKSSWYAHC